MLSPNLEQSLHRALAHAKERRHEYATLEHLLLALADDQDAIAVMRACNVDIERLRRDLTEYVDSQLASLVGNSAGEAKPTAGFQRVLQRAAIHVQSSGREEATRIMMHVHRRGVGICGVFTYEVAETKVAQVIDFARRHEHPLQCTLEKE